MIGFGQYSNYNLKSLLILRDNLIKEMSVKLTRMDSEQVKSYKKRLVAINSAIAKKQK
jgi:hypothetical protein